MITKNRIKFIRSLHNKKERIQYKMFIAEGGKIVSELLDSQHSFQSIYCVNDSEDSFREMEGCELISAKEMKMISSMKNPPGVMAIIDFLLWPTPDFNKGRYLFLDRINNPGNLGTIIRIADWFGFDGLICSENSVDLYNPKTIQSAMGSVFHTPVFYSESKDFFEKLNPDVQVIGAVLDGTSIENFHFPENGILLIGSESHGIDSHLDKYLNNRVMIPRIGSAESLNVAVATGILAREFALSSKD